MSCVMLIPKCPFCNHMAASTVQMNEIWNGPGNFARMPAVVYVCGNRECEHSAQAIEPHWKEITVGDRT